MNEIFKDISGFEGKYQISNLGNVKSLNYKGTGKEKLLKGLKTKSYLYINLSLKGKITIFRIHRLVALTFLENPNNKPCVNHKNGIKDDNRLENLEWCTVSENTLHGYRVLGRKSSKPMLGKKGILNKKSKKVNQYTLDGEFIKTWDSIMDIKRELGISHGNISEACRELRQKTAKGFIWKYKIIKYEINN